MFSLTLDLRMTLKIQILSLVTSLLRVGIVENPKSQGTDSVLNTDKAALYALRLTGVGYSETTFC